jgi:carbonic anhydrase
MTLNDFLGRRRLFQQAAIAGATLITGLGSQPASAWAETASAAAAPPRVTADEALKRLLEGNQRFIRQQPQYPHQSLQRLKETAQGQQPFAVILSCADSRVPPEILMDAGIGDLFDVRVAGNIVTPEVLGSIEYAVLELGTPLIMVLGHERCGAVTAAVRGKPLPGHIGSLVAGIQPALSKVKRTAKDVVETAVVANVQLQVYEMKQQSPLLANLVSQHQLKIVGARYDLDLGEVTIV